ncbi:MAG: thiamine diphosphokinase [Alphaproteobacteria bacterium]|nr:thiamine diphosphokinase [Alphaproteobacteria bacterium]
MSKYAILLGGPVALSDRLQRQVRGARFIAADSGISHAPLLNAVVELWVGDFDSVSPKLSVAHKNIERHIYPNDKEKTDGEIAIQEAIQKGAQHIIMVGGLGGASDHVLAHLTQMLALAESGITILATSGYEEAWPLLPGHTYLEIPAGTRLSIIGFTPLHDLSLSNLFWPLRKKDIPFGSTLTLSNKALGNVEITLKKGRGVIMASIPRKTPQETA